MPDYKKLEKFLPQDWNRDDYSENAVHSGIRTIHRYASMNSIFLTYCMSRGHSLAALTDFTEDQRSAYYEDMQRFFREHPTYGEPGYALSYGKLQENASMYGDMLRKGHEMLMQEEFPRFAYDKVNDPAVKSYVGIIGTMAIDWQQSIQFTYDSQNSKKYQGFLAAHPGFIRGAGGAANLRRIESDTDVIGIFREIIKWSDRRYEEENLFNQAIGKRFEEFTREFTGKMAGQKLSAINDHLQSESFKKYTRSLTIPGEFNELQNEYTDKKAENAMWRAYLQGDKALEEYISDKKIKKNFTQFELPAKNKAENRESAAQKRQDYMQNLQDSEEISRSIIEPLQQGSASLKNEEAAQREQAVQEFQYANLKSTVQHLYRQIQREQENVNYAQLKKRIGILEKMQNMLDPENGVNVAPADQQQAMRDAVNNELTVAQKEVQQVEEKLAASIILVDELTGRVPLGSTKAYMEQHGGQQFLKEQLGHSQDETVKNQTLDNLMRMHPSQIHLHDGNTEQMNLEERYLYERMQAGDDLRKAASDRLEQLSALPERNVGDKLDRMQKLYDAYSVVSPSPMDAIAFGDTVLKSMQAVPMPKAGNVRRRMMQEKNTALDHVEGKNKQLIKSYDPPKKLANMSYSDFVDSKHDEKVIRKIARDSGINGEIEAKERFSSFVLLHALTQGKSLTEINDMSPQQKLALGDAAIQFLKDHPTQGTETENLSEEQIGENFYAYGKLFHDAGVQLGKQRMPYLTIGTPEQQKETTKLLGLFNDYTQFQGDKNFGYKDQISANPKFIQGFSGGEAFHRITQQAAMVGTFVAYAGNDALLENQANIQRDPDNKEHAEVANKLIRDDIGYITGKMEGRPLEQFQELFPDRKAEEAVYQLKALKVASKMMSEQDRKAYLKGELKYADIPVVKDVISVAAKDQYQLNEDSKEKIERHRNLLMNMDESRLQSFVNSLVTSESTKSMKWLEENREGLGDMHVLAQDLIQKSAHMSQRYTKERGHLSKVINDVETNVYRDIDAMDQIKQLSKDLQNGKVSDKVKSSFPELNLTEDSDDRALLAQMFRNQLPKYQRDIHMQKETGKFLVGVTDMLVDAKPKKEVEATFSSLPEAVQERIQKNFKASVNSYVPQYDKDIKERLNGLPGFMEIGNQPPKDIEAQKPRSLEFFKDKNIDLDRFRRHLKNGNLRDEEKSYIQKLMQDGIPSLSSQGQVNRRKEMDIDIFDCITIDGKTVRNYCKENLGKDLAPEAIDSELLTREYLCAALDPQKLLTVSHVVAENGVNKLADPVVLQRDGEMIHKKLGFFGSIGHALSSSHYDTKGTWNRVNEGNLNKEAKLQEAAAAIQEENRKLAGEAAFDENRGGLQEQNAADGKENSEKKKIDFEKLSQNLHKDKPEPKKRSQSVSQPQQKKTENQIKM